jgi:DNA polymerase-3 subunit delta
VIYYFYGQDEWGVKQALKKISATFVGDQKETITLDGSEINSSQLEQEVISVSFFTKQRLIIVENLSKNKKSTEVEKVLELLKKKIDHIDLVFAEFGSPDKRTAFHKQLSKIGEAKEFMIPTPAILSNRIKELVATNNSKISNQAVYLLSAMIPTDSLRLQNEVEKLSLLRLSSEITVEDVSEMVVAELNSNIFNFVESLASQNLKGTFLALDKLLQAGQNENYILTMIVWQYRQLIIVRSLLDKGQATAGSAGINPYVFGKVLAIAKKYTLDRLKSIYKRIEEADCSMKTGEMEAKPALELVAAKILSC